MIKLVNIRKKKNPLISVIVPTYQEEKYIEQTLTAISNQTLERNKYEIIVSDSNSKDKTIEIAKRYADKIVISDKRGIAVGRNLGAKYANGKYLVFIDADTIILPKTLEKIVKELKKCDCVIPKLFPSKPSFVLSFYFGIYNLVISFLNFFKAPQASGPFIAVKRKVFEKLNGFNEKLETYEDVDFIKRVSKIGKVKIINLPVITSTRRFEKEGKIRLALKYILYSLLFNLFGIYIKNYRPVR
jgi:glycosyltransferase involved in cell wall biosynthesis